MRTSVKYAYFEGSAMKTYEENLGYVQVVAGRGWLSRALDAVALWHERARSRRDLQGMSDFMLHDIGLDRGIAEREAAKLFWQR